MTNPMLAELDEVVRLMEAATEGEWGSWHLPASGTSGDAFGHLIGPPIRYRDRSQGFTPDDAHLIARSVNFLRTHHATLADMAKDAARYRWLRNHRLDFIVRNNSADPRLSLPMGTDLMEPSAADACIDAAIAATQEGEAD